MKKVFVLGSINMDYTVSVNGMPRIGESKVGYGFTVNQGGKGANQAVACKKLGCESVSLIACVGKDATGKALTDSVASYGVDTAAVALCDEAPSGACMILLDDVQKDNMLVVDRGANQYVSSSFVETYLRRNASAGDVLISQLEINVDAVYAALAAAHKIGMYVILNPAPVVDFDRSCLQNVDLIVPNEVETQLLTGFSAEDGDAVFRYFASFGVPETVVTLGGKGSLYLGKTGAKACPAYPVRAVDTTSAGDTFIGALAMRKACGAAVADSLEFAALCSAVTVSRKGASVSIPTAEEVEKIQVGKRI